MTGPPGERGGSAAQQTRPSDRSQPHQPQRSDRRSKPSFESPRLSADHKVVLEAVTRAAERGEPAPSTDDLLDLLPHRSSVSGPIALLRDLERHNLIRVVSCQRGRLIIVVSTRQMTALPRSLAPPWRHRRMARCG